MSFAMRFAFIKAASRSRLYARFRSQIFTFVLAFEDLRLALEWKIRDYDMGKEADIGLATVDGPSWRGASNTPTPLPALRSRLTYFGRTRRMA